MRRYRPQVVVGCWITHKYDAARPQAGGNAIGVDEPDILRHCETYILVGNEKVHAPKVIWSRPHEVHYLPFVYSRAVNGSREFVAIWQGSAGRRDRPGAATVS